MYVHRNQQRLAQTVKPQSTHLSRSCVVLCKNSPMFFHSSNCSWPCISSVGLFYCSLTKQWSPLFLQFAISITCILFTDASSWTYVLRGRGKREGGVRGDGVGRTESTNRLKFQLGNTYRLRPRTKQQRSLSLYNDLNYKTHLLQCTCHESRKPFTGWMWLLNTARLHQEERELAARRYRT